MNDAIFVPKWAYDALGKAVSKATNSLCRWDLDKIEDRINDHASVREEG